MKIYLVRECDVEALLVAIQPTPGETNIAYEDDALTRTVNGRVSDERRRVQYQVHLWLNRIKADMP